MDALALSTTVLSAGAIVAASAGGAWGKLRAKNKTETSRASYYLLSPAQHLWRSAQERLINVAELCEGAGILPDDATFHYVPAPTWIPAFRGASQAQRCLVTIPASASTRFRHAAAGCGAVAVPAPNDIDPAGSLSASMPSHVASAKVAVPTESGWLLGLNGYGRAVELFPVPGSTIVLTGPLPLIRIALHQLSWLPSLFKVLGVQDEAPEQELESQWRAAWDPNRTRIVVAPHGATPPAIMSAADALVELSADANSSVLSPARSFETSTGRHNCREELPFTFRTIQQPSHSISVDA